MSRDPENPDKPEVEVLPTVEYGSADPGVEPDDPDAADRAAANAPDVSEAYEAANERGANVEGEGAIDDREGRV